VICNVRCHGSAFKNIMYTVVNSRAYANGDSFGTTPTWKKVTYGVDVLVALLCVGLIVLTVKGSKKRNNIVVE